MAITIAGIRITEFNVSKVDTEELKVTGKYSLISNTGTVIAKQSFNCYGDISLPQSPETMQAIQNVLSKAKKDLNTTLGLEE